MAALLNQSWASQLYQQQQQAVPRPVSFFLGSCINWWHHPNPPGFNAIMLFICSGYIHPGHSKPYWWYSCNLPQCNILLLPEFYAISFAMTMQDTHLTNWRFPCHKQIADLRNTGDVAESSEQVGHYWLELGRRSKYHLHMVIAILSYILFGLLPPVIYGLSFRTSDNRENKMLVVAAVSLLCIALLAIGKAHVKRPRTYFTTLLYYLSIGFSGSGLSYATGVLIMKLLAHFGIIDQGGASAPAPPGLSFPEAVAWASYWALSPHLVVLMVQ